MRRTCGAMVALTAVLAATGALPQTKPAPAPAAAPSPAPAAADPAYEAQKTAFLALPDGERKAIQDDLSWLGLYNGVVDGGFGKRTRDAIVAYQTGIKATVDGVLGPSLVTALKAAADKVKASVGFAVIDDAKTGIRYGAPLKLLDKRTAAPGELALTRADGTMKLAITDNEGAGADLAGLFAKLVAETPTRKVAYKALRVNAFFVVAGAEDGKKFYSRYELSPDPAKVSVRGFTFSYPEARSDLDRVALAIANSFQPFAAAANPDATAAAAPAPAPRPSAAPTPVATAKPVAAVPGPGYKGIALVTGPGQAVTTLAQGACAHPLIGGKPATFGKANDGGNLVTLTGDFAPHGAPPALAATAPNEGIVVAFAEIQTPRLEASAAKLLMQADQAILIAPLGKDGAGAPIFSREGALIGLAQAAFGEPPRLGGHLVGAPRGYVGAGELAKFLGAGAAPGSAAMSVGDLLVAEREAVVGIGCAP